MGNFALAVRYGIKDFFGRQTDHGDYRKAWKSGRRGDRDGKWSYPDLVMLTVLAGMHQHSFGIPGSIIQAIRAGRWHYHDLKDIEIRAAESFEGTGMSPEGRKLVIKMLKRRKGIDPHQLSAEDSQIMQEIVNTVHVGTVNF